MGIEILIFALIGIGVVRCYQGGRHTEQLEAIHRQLADINNDRRMKEYHHDQDDD
jgi:hypothetical protein